MKNFLAVVQDRFRSDVNADAEAILETTVRNALSSDLPSLDFLEESGIADEGVVTKNIRKNLRIDGRDGEIHEFRVVGNNLRILKTSSMTESFDIVEMYYEDELVFRATGESKWVDFKEFGVDDGDLVWSITRVDLFQRGLWEKDLKKLHICQEEEVNSRTSQSPDSDNTVKSNNTNKVFSKLEIEEKSDT